MPVSASRVSRLLSGAALSVGSQLTGLVQLVLLLYRAHTGQATDAYFYLFTFGLLPVHIVLAGVVYPMLLNARRITRRGLIRARSWTLVFCVFAVAVAGLFLTSNDRLPSSLLPMAALVLTNSLFQALLWFRAILAEAGGSSKWISSVALPANAGAVLALVLPWGDPVVATTAMVAGLNVGNLAFLVLMRRKRVGDAVMGAAPLTRDGGRAAPWWFLSKSAANHLGLAALQSFAVSLPPSAITLLNVGIKIAGSIAASLVNAVMPILVHDTTADPAAAKRYVRLLTGILLLFGSALVAFAALRQPDLTLLAACLGLWIVATSAISAAFRIAYRFLPARASGATLVAFPVVAALTWLSSTSDRFQLPVLFCAYAAADGLIALVLLRGVRDHIMTVALLLVLGALAGLWVTALVT